MKTRFTPSTRRPLLLALAAIACATILSAGSASAQIIFTLNNVSLVVPGTTTAAGSLSGYFEISGNTVTSTTQLLTYNISATSTTGLSHNFVGTTYNPADSTAYYTVGNSGLLTGLQLDIPSSGSPADMLRFYFATNLTATGTTALDNTSNSSISYENEQVSGGNRNVSAGNVSAAAAPEPSAWALSLAALALFAGLRLRQRQAAPATNW
jgi:MYXO-CTERM domain-containing protein